jgi:hypothetical protein
MPLKLQAEHERLQFILGGADADADTVSETVVTT